MYLSITLYFLFSDRFNLRLKNNDIFDWYYKIVGILVFICTVIFVFNQYKLLLGLEIPALFLVGFLMIFILGDLVYKIITIINRIENSIEKITVIIGFFGIIISLLNVIN